MAGRPHWAHCVAHYGPEVGRFVSEYFKDAKRRCLLVAAAGFDPRSAAVAEVLAGTLGSRLRGVFIREERPNPDVNLVKHGDANEAHLCRLVPESVVHHIEVLAADNAVIGGRAIVDILGRIDLNDVTDVVLDLSVLTVGVGFPAARFLLEKCEQVGGSLGFHLMLGCHPAGDGAVRGVPNDKVSFVHGFRGTLQLEGSDEAAKIWLPQLAMNKQTALEVIRGELPDPYDVCPILPFPAGDARAADKLIEVYRRELYDDWEVDPRNIIYAAESDPLDLYRAIRAIDLRHRQIFEEFPGSHVILSPLGSKVLASGALMAALDRNLPVQYVEDLTYEVDWKVAEKIAREQIELVHVWLHGVAYGKIVDRAPGNVASG
jgi:hypothetical protein